MTVCLEGHETLQQGRLPGAIVSEDDGPLGRATVPVRKVERLSRTEAADVLDLEAQQVGGIVGHGKDGITAAFPPLQGGQILQSEREDLPSGSSLRTGGHEENPAESVACLLDHGEFLGGSGACIGGHEDFLTDSRGGSGGHEEISMKSAFDPGGGMQLPLG